MSERRLHSILGPRPDRYPEVLAVLRGFAQRYPEDISELLATDEPRMAEHVHWALGARRLLDVGGGGLTVFAPACQLLGVKATVVDSFDHPDFARRNELSRMLVDLGVEFVAQDAVDGERLPFDDATFDAVTSFDSLEHWHHSPRRLFAELRRIATPGALLVLAAPNAVNLRKRLVVPLGQTNWSRFEDWYEPERFHGHVREPTVRDFVAIANDIGLREWTIVGRNWLGRRRDGALRHVERAVDPLLRLRPSLAANLYLIGRFGV